MAKKKELKIFQFPVRGIVNIKAEDKEKAEQILLTESVTMPNPEIRSWPTIFFEGFRDNLGYITSLLVFWISIVTFARFFAEMTSYFTNPFLHWLTTAGYIMIIFWISNKTFRLFSFNKGRYL